MIRFYNQQHRFYCGVDLHTRRLATQPEELFGGVRSLQCARLPEFSAFSAYS